MSRGIFSGELNWMDRYILTSGKTGACQKNVSRLYTSTAIRRKERKEQKHNLKLYLAHKCEETEKKTPVQGQETNSVGEARTTNAYSIECFCRYPQFCFVIS